MYTKKRLRQSIEVKTMLANNGHESGGGIIKKKKNLEIHAGTLCHNTCH